MSEAAVLNDSANPVIVGVADEFLHVVSEIPPFVASAIETVADARAGNLEGALESGVHTVEQGVQILKDAAPVVKTVADDVANMAKSSQMVNDVSHVISHLVSGGVIGMIEHEVGPMTDSVKGRLGSFIRGMVHAASVLAHQE